MILDALQLTLDRNKEKSPLFLRNLLKEQLQQYVLNFVYNSSYAERFLFYIVHVSFCYLRYNDFIIL
jgi:hypothetical protein